MSSTSPADTLPTLVDAEPAGESVGWRRLAPRMLIVHPVQELVRALPGLLGLLIAGASTGHGSIWTWAGAGLVAARGALRWFTTSYRITPERVEVRRGLLRRGVVAVPRDRVRTVDVTAPPVHRLLGLARVTVGTGQSHPRHDDALQLDALTDAAALALRAELLHTRPARPAEPPAAAEPGEVELVRSHPGWVRFAPFTLSGLLAVAVAVGFVTRLSSETHVDPESVGPVRDVLDRVARLPPALVAAEAAVALLVAAALAAMVGYVLAFGNFRLVRHPRGTLQVTRGLVTARSTTLEERRVQGVELDEPLPLRTVRGARCVAIATGLRHGRGADRAGSLLLPPAPAADARRVAAAVLRSAEPVTGSLVRHGPRARRRRYTRALAGAGVPILGLLLLTRFAGLPARAWQAALVLLPLAGLLAADRAASLGHAVVAGRLVTRTGSLVRRRAALSCDGILGWTLRASYFQRRAGLVTLVATTAAGRAHYAVPDVELAEALQVAEAAVPGLLAPYLVPESEPP